MPSASLPWRPTVTIILFRQPLSVAGVYHLRVQKIPEADESRIVLVDTNCFLRLYSLPKLPFWGAVGGYRLMTLRALVEEFLCGARLQTEYAWVNPIFSAENRSQIELTLDEAQLLAVHREVDAHRDYVDDLLYDHCRERGIGIRSLSRNDMDLLATAIALRAVIATDEWPLRLVVDDLTRNGDEDDYGIEVFTSLHALKVLEEGQFLSAEERRSTVKSWLRSGEKLPRTWESDYRQLFNEAPLFPT